MQSISRVKWSVLGSFVVSSSFSLRKSTGGGRVFFVCPEEPSSGWAKGLLSLPGSLLIDRRRLGMGATCLYQKDFKLFYISSELLCSAAVLMFPLQKVLVVGGLNLQMALAYDFRVLIANADLGGG